jgi:hypothetical protein
MIDWSPWPAWLVDGLAVALLAAGVAGLVLAFMWARRAPAPDVEPAAG